MRVGDHEAAEQADAELAEVVAARQVEEVALGAAADGRQQLGDLGGGEADAVVAANRNASRLGRRWTAG